MQSNKVAFKDHFRDCLTYFVVLVTVGVLIENEREVPVVYVYFIKVLFFVIKSKYFVFKNASNNDLNMRGKVTYV